MKVLSITEIISSKPAGERYRCELSFYTLALSEFWLWKIQTRNQNFVQNRTNNRGEAHDALFNTEKLKPSTEVMFHGHLSKREKQSGSA